MPTSLLVLGCLLFVASSQPAHAPAGPARATHSTRGGRPLSYRELNDRLTRPGNGLGDIHQIDLAALHLEVPK
jgi:hypothetical protein